MSETVNWGLIFMLIILVVLIIAGIWWLIPKSTDEEKVQDNYIDDYQKFSKIAVGECNKKRMEFVTARKITTWEAVCVTPSPYRVHVFGLE